MVSSSSMTQCKASCVVLSSTSSGTQIASTVSVLGCLQLSQSTLAASANAGVRITGTLSHLAPGPHGIAIATSGDMSQGATSCGPIFNPFGKTHGAPTDEQRMVGDLGNIVADEHGVAIVDITDTIISLLGPHSIVGRSLVLTSGADDMGRGGHENSLVTGNSGPRVAAGIIGISAN